MPQPKSPAAYQDLIDGVLYPALESKGVRLTFPTSGKAIAGANRLRAAIRMLRLQSLSVFPIEHPRHGRTDFDSLVIQAEDCTVEVRTSDPANAAARLGAVAQEVIE